MGTKGGKPYVRRQSIKGVPIGIEKVLFEAAGDPAFREALEADREAALLARGFRLRDSEHAMLMAIPAGQLASAIDGMDITTANVQRRKFMRVVAASAMTIAAAETIGCESATDGNRPDMPEDAGVDVPNVGANNGIRPDPPDAAEDGPDDAKTDAVDMPAGAESAGIRPDGWEE